MTPNDRRTHFTSDQLSRAFTDLATPSRPDYRDELLQRTASTRQRPTWTFIERWLPMTIVTLRHSPAPPLRAVWILLLVGLLTAALITGIAITGSQWLRDSDQRTNAFLPVLIEHDPIDLSDLSAPWGIDVGPDGNLYVVNGGTNEILVIDPSGRELRRWGAPGTGEGQFLFQYAPDDPLGSNGSVAVAPDGSVYVTDLVNDRVQQFTSDGDFVRAWGGHGPDDGQFLEPTDIAVGPDGSLYVLDYLRDDIQRFSASGEWLETIGRHGSTAGELNSTYGLSVDASGTILNADYGNHRVQAWDATGAPLWSRDGVSYPFDVVSGLDGAVYVTDEAGVKVYTDGRRSPSMYRPSGWDGVGYLAAADDGTVYVSNPPMHRIERLTLSFEEGDGPATSSVAADASPISATSSDATQLDDQMGSADEPEGGPSSMRIGDEFVAPFSVELPSTGNGYPAATENGWWLYDEEPGFASFAYVRGSEATPTWVELYIPAGVFRDPCHPQDGKLTTSQHPGVDELVEALTHQVGMRAGPVTDISFGDVHGKSFVLDNNIDMSDCRDTPWLRHWTYYTLGPDHGVVLQGEGLQGERMRIAIVDVDGTPVLINQWELGARREEVIEANELFDSIRFE